ncbi:MAG: BtrH N-terminal domain-containing protein [Cyclobacteriaceae bacterium]|nr:BtrH N-terminal domain-containing protein [Cyclobacteriaceae bacterium]
MDKTTTPTVKFNHLQTAHCENGVTTSLLQHHGIDFMSEPLAFGLGAGLFYIHVPLITVLNGPFISFRTLPGTIFKRTCKALGVKVERIKFSNKNTAQDYLDKQIEKGRLVGSQVGVFHLPYFPPEYRFHFNAHNIIIYGKDQEGNYLVSDPVMETTNVLTPNELQKVRFAQGPLAPKGQLYYPVNVSKVSTDLLKKGIIKGIKRNVRDMLYIPGFFAGSKGIKFTAGQVRKWRDKLGQRKAGLYLGQIVRMQEEIGTGGGGFRFLYAAFLEESASYFDGNEELLKASEQITKAGDLWRDSAVQMAGIYKGRLTEQSDYNLSASILEEISNVEQQAFRQLSKLKLSS